MTPVEKLQLVLGVLTVWGLGITGWYGGKYLSTLTPVEALRVTWGFLTWLGAFGVTWHTAVVFRALALWKWGKDRELPWDDREAIAGRLRNASYRLAIKVCLTGFSASCWAIFTQQDIAKGWALVWVATGLFGTAMVLLTVWSWHAWQAAQRRRPSAKRQ